jgi:hypothetical protein
MNHFIGLAQLFAVVLACVSIVFTSPSTSDILNVDAISSYSHLSAAQACDYP